MTHKGKCADLDGWLSIKDHNSTQEQHTSYYSIGTVVSELRFS